MKKIYCDICGKEIKGEDSVYDYKLFSSKEQPLYFNLNSHKEDVCKRCATVIYKCITMMGKVGWEPDFHEVLDHGSMWDREKAADKLSQLEEIYERKIMK